MLLVPALLVSSSIALLVWAWAVGSFLVARWLYNRVPISASVAKDGNGVQGKIERTD
jgi:hypothetical protein